MPVTEVDAVEEGSSPLVATPSTATFPTADEATGNRGASTTTVVPPSSILGRVSTVPPAVSPAGLDLPLATVSWYGSESGSVTANGEAFNPDDLTFAHKSMEFGTLVRFTGPAGSVVARCSDRGPFIAGRLFDLSRGAFARIAPLSAGVAIVSWEVLT